MQSYPILVSSCDDAFAVGLATMLKSVSINTHYHRIDTIVLDGGISEANKVKITKNFNNTNIKIEFITVNDAVFSGFKTTANITTSTYYRLLLPSILSADVGKVLYLDSDLIVECDVDELFSIRFQETIAAVPDMDKRAHFVSDQGGLKLYHELGIPATNRYFNAGVMLINLDKWRFSNASERIIHYLSANMEHVLWLDQDGLNAVLWNDWYELKPCYNVTTILYKVSSWEESVFNKPGFDELYLYPKILHYTHKKKPWHDNCNHPMKHRYWHYYNLLIW